MKKAIILGASSGIGKRLALLLAENNYQVGIVGRRLHLLSEIEKSKPTHFIVKQLNLTSNKNKAVLEALVSELGGLDLLVISSGTGYLNEALVFKYEKKTIELNVLAFTEVADWAFHFFERQQHGHLLAISSVAGLRGSKIAPAYNASKSFQINYLEGLRQKAKALKLPLTVSDIRPGFVDTAMAKGEGQFWVSSPEKAAKQIFSAIKKRKKIAYISRRWYVIALIIRLLPNWLYERM